MSDSLTLLLTDSQVVKLQALLEQRGYEPREVPYAVYSYSGNKTVVTVYRKNNKLLIQGSGLKEFVEFILEPEILADTLFGGGSGCAAMDTEAFRPHFGIDESGKGDYFGPLVIAGVYADPAIASALIKMGVCDSKLISSPAKIRSLAASIKKIPGIAHVIIRVGPERYNEFYAKIGNLNRLLAWGHARVIELLLEKVPGCRHALSDQFARASVLEGTLKSMGVKINLEQRTKAESDVAVAAASILARERFVAWMDESSEKSGIKIPLGASKQVVRAGRDIVEKYGEEMLPKVAKMHFKTTQEVLNRKA